MSIVVGKTHAKINQPSGWKVDLLDHQLTTVKKCLDIENGSTVRKFGNPEINFGVIANGKGHGKTYIALALCSFSIKKGNGINVIVVDGRMVKHWEMHLKYTNIPWVVFKTRKRIETIGMAKICLVPSGMFLEFATKHKDEIFSRMFIDDTMNITVPGATKQGITAKMNWLICSDLGSIKCMWFPLFIRLIPNSRVFRSEYSHLICVTASKQYTQASMERLKITPTVIEYSTDSEPISDLIASGDTFKAIAEMGIDTFSSIKDIVYSVRQRKDKAKKAMMRLANSKDCPITLEVINVPAISKCCFVKFEAIAILSVIASDAPKCPMCRKRINALDLAVYGEPVHTETLSLQRVYADLFKRFKDKRVVVYYESNSFLYSVTNTEVLRNITEGSYNPSIAAKWFNRHHKFGKILMVNSSTMYKLPCLESVDVLVIDSSEHVFSYDYKMMIRICEKVGRAGDLQVIEVTGKK
jgi:hypothetical protein